MQLTYFKMSLISLKLWVVLDFAGGRLKVDYLHLW